MVSVTSATSYEQVPPAYESLPAPSPLSQFTLHQDGVAYEKFWWTVWRKYIRISSFPPGKESSSVMVGDGDILGASYLELSVAWPVITWADVITDLLLLLHSMYKVTKPPLVFFHLPQCNLVYDALYKRARDSGGEHWIGVELQSAGHKYTAKDWRMRERARENWINSAAPTPINDSTRACIVFASLLRRVGTRLTWFNLTKKRRRHRIMSGRMYPS